MGNGCKAKKHAVTAAISTPPADAGKQSARQTAVASKAASADTELPAAAQGVIDSSLAAIQGVSGSSAAPAVAEFDAGSFAASAEAERLQPDKRSAKFMAVPADVEKSTDCGGTRGFG